ncbi:MAG: hypothetical protein IPM29_24945 [Planctomycetes bacterium]|nr:hypothetical protein [Planctomycetota bacterium]
MLTTSIASLFPALGVRLALVAVDIPPQDPPASSVFDGRWLFGIALFGFVTLMLVARRRARRSSARKYTS